MAERIIRFKAASERLSVCTKTLQNWVRTGEFPKPIQLGPRARGWLESDFERAIAAKKNKNQS